MKDVLQRSRAAIATTSLVACAGVSSAIAVSAQLPSPPPATVEITGRCLAAEDSTPLPGCRITVTGRTAAGQPLAVDSPSWFAPEPATSDAAGRFALRVAWPLGRGGRQPGHFILRVESTGRTEYSESVLVPRLFAQRGRRLGDLKLTRGVRVQVRIVDTDGKAVHGVKITAVPRNPQPAGEPTSAPDAGPPAERGPRREGDAYVGCSDARGNVEWQHPSSGVLPTGTWQLLPVAREAQQKAPVLALDAAAPGQAERTVEITVGPEQREHTIRGSCADAAGKPVAGLALELSVGKIALAHSTTNARGEFFFATPKGRDGKTARIATLPPEAAWSPAPPRSLSFGTYEFGNQTVRLRLPKQTQLLVQVQQPEELEPATDTARQFTVLASPVSVNGRSTQGLLTRIPATDEPFPLDGLQAGVWHISVHASDGSFAPIGRNITVTADGKVLNTPAPKGRAPMDVCILRPNAAVECTWVLLCDNQPQAGVTVDLLVAHGMKTGTALSRAIDHNGGPLAYNGSVNERQPLVVDRAVSDDQGRVVLRAESKLAHVALRIHGPGVQPFCKVLGSLPARAQAQGSERTTPVPEPIDVRQAAQLVGSVAAADMDQIRRLDWTRESALATARVSGQGPNDWPGSVAAKRRRTRPYLVVRQRGEVCRAFVPIQDDGSFDTGALPPGPLAIELHVPLDPKPAQGGPVALFLGTGERVTKSFEIWRGTLPAGRRSAPPLVLPAAVREQPVRPPKLPPAGKDAAKREL
ncbi:MAG: hypothetical protein AB8H80_21255 [Planctomycetota bacterium]